MPSDIDGMHQTTCLFAQRRRGSVGSVSATIEQRRALPTVSKYSGSQATLLAVWKDDPFSCSRAEPQAHIPGAIIHFFDGSLRARTLEGDRGSDPRTSSHAEFKA